MPYYDYRCRECDLVFELRRTMADAGSPATCPGGHTRVVRLLPALAMAGKSAAGFGQGGRAEGGGPDAAGGPPCGGDCTCGRY